MKYKNGKFKLNNTEIAAIRSHAGKLAKDASKAASFKKVGFVYGWFDPETADIHYTEGDTDTPINPGNLELIATAPLDMREEKKDIVVYHLQSTIAKASGYFSIGGFTIQKGSTISKEVTQSLQLACKWYCTLRDQLVADGIIKDGVFQEDYEFSSKTAASSVILGRTGGNGKWKQHQEDN